MGSISHMVIHKVNALYDVKKKTLRVKKIMLNLPLSFFAVQRCCAAVLLLSGLCDTSLF